MEGKMKPIKDAGGGNRKMRSLSRVLTINLGVVVASVFIIATLFSYWFLSHRSKILHEQKSEEYIHYLLESLEAPIWNMNADMVEKICRAFTKNETAALLRVTYENGVAVFEAGSETEPDLEKKRAPLMHGSQVVGHVELGLTPRVYREANRRLLAASVFTMLLVVAGLVLAANVVTRRLLQTPLDQLIRRIRGIAAGEYEEPGSPSKNREFAAILEEFNRMAERVEERERTLVRVNRRLEDQIAERRRLEKQFFQAQKMEAIGQLAGGVAHDFNNLIQVIQGYSELALMENKADVSMRGAFEEVLKASDRGATLVRQLLAFSRKQVLTLGDLNLDDVVVDLAKMIQRVIGEHIAFNVHSDPGHKWIRADKGQIEQVLMNLCVNARDAMSNGGALSIETDEAELDETFLKANTWAKPGRHVLVKVVDTGRGMDEETRRRIFEPFFTTKSLSEGTGLGLSTVFGIVRQHNGVVHVKSEVGVGSSFEIYLPAAEKPGRSAEENIVAPSAGGEETILLADDDKMVRLVAREMLRGVGYTVLMARDGKEAIRVFDEHADKIDMALLDVVMPKLGGKAVFDHIRANRPRVRALFTSAYSGDFFKGDFAPDKDSRLIDKPYHRDNLLRTVRETLDG